ncbi:6089_t:CDS:1, partial [Gigaspora rosea]
TLNNLSKTTDNFKMQNKIDKLSNLSAKLSKIYIDLTNNGSEFIQISKLIKEIIVKHQETPQRMFEYLCENQDNDLDSCILGFFYLEGIGTSEDYKDAFNMFEKTANQISIAKFYLGECFRCGYGTEKNLKSAITWYEKAEADGHARSINALGLCYIKEIGVNMTEIKHLIILTNHMKWVISLHAIIWEIVTSSEEEQKQTKKKHSNIILKLQPKTFLL